MDGAKIGIVHCVFCLEEERERMRTKRRSRCFPEQRCGAKPQVVFGDLFDYRIV